MSTTINVEIKARCTDPERVRRFLNSQHARFVGTDHQCDTYFNTFSGRLKLREGNIENNLIYYERDNQAGPKTSVFILTPVAEPKPLKDSLTNSLGIFKVVKKKREIYFIENVKFHIDEVEPLGTFVEIEACNKNTPFTREALQKQCEMYMNEMGILPVHLLTHSYSDMI
ncbi:MAG: class IV adenylate cyclase [Dinghuibacter sp.]|nr:class IV adenylate cyclase [Dinghuibacter sp.]